MTLEPEFAIGDLLDRLSVPRNSAIFTDFDGTLAPIVEDAGSAEALSGAADILRDLASRYAEVAVVSGRPVSFLVAALDYRSSEFDSSDPPGERRRSDSSYPLLCGLYGLERWHPDGSITTDPRAEAWRGIVSRAAGRAAEIFGEGGVEVEHKGLGVTLHWRRHPASMQRARAVGKQLAAELGLTALEGKMCIELVPDLPVDKGSVVAELLDRTPEIRSACFIGDDMGDVAAFRALDDTAARRAGRGISPAFTGVKVAVAGPEAPPGLLAEADLILASPADVLDVLRKLYHAQ